MWSPQPLWSDTDKDAPQPSLRMQLSVSDLFQFQHNLTLTGGSCSGVCQRHYIQLLGVCAKETKMQNIFLLSAWPMSVSVRMLLCSLLA